MLLRGRVVVGLAATLVVLATLRTHRNHRDYRLGHRVAVTVWGARAWRPWLSTSLRLAWESWGNVEDDALDPTLVPTADPDRRGGRRLDLALSANLLVRDGALRGHRFAVEAMRPVHQGLDGPQLEMAWRIAAGWQRAF